MVKPIRRNLLIHSVIYKKYIEADMWGNTQAEPITLSNVRVEPKEILVTGTDNRQVNCNAILFHDTTFSTPCDWVLESKVVFNNREMTVKAINEYYDDTRLHHTEVGLV